MEAGAIGIDLGSKNTVIAVVKNRGVEVVQSESGCVTPTVIGLGDGERKFGDTAVLTAKSNFKNTIWGFNRFLGMKQTSPYLKKELKFASAKCVPVEKKGIGFELRYKGEQKVFTPEQLCAMYLSKLRKTYENAGITCKDVVISVPPYFSSVERQALIDAVRIAGLNCCKLMNETTAIGLYYGLFRNSEFSENPRKVMFLDLGYSKLTVSVMAFKRSGFSILGQGWEPYLGARNMDAAVMQKLVEDFSKKYKKDFRENPKAIVRVSEAIEKTRKILSANTETAINVESVMDDRDVCCNLTRKEFEEIIAPLLEIIANLCKKVLDEANVKAEEIYTIEMVGEASRIPAVIKKVHDCVGAPTSRTMNSADCIARGCATQCAMLNPLFKVKEYGIVDYNPFPVDVVYSLPKTDKEPAQKKIITLFTKGCNFPVVKALSFENRRDLLQMQLKYNSVPLGGPILLGNYKTSVGELVKENKFALSVKIALDHNMISSVTAAEVIEDFFEEKKVAVKCNVPVQKNPEKSEGKKEAPAQKEYEIQRIPRKYKTAIDLAFEVHGLSNRKVQEFSEQEEKMGHEDMLIIQTKEMKNSLESYIYEMRAKIPSELREYIDPNTAQKYMETLEKAEGWLFNEGQNQPKSEYAKKLEELAIIGEAVKKRYKAFEALSEQAMILTKTIYKAQKIVDILQKSNTNEHSQRLTKLFEDQMSWVRQTAEILNKCPRTKDPTVKVSDYVNRIKTIEEEIKRLEKMKQ